jgi:biopolymer transport protein ExbD
MGAWANRDAGEVTSHGIDLAPMLDFVTNLLIFFIITAVFTKESGIAVNRPTSSDEGGKLAWTIEVDEGGEVVIGGRPVDVRAIRANVERMKAEIDGAGVLVVAHERAPTGLLVTVVDQVRLGGVMDITFTTTKVNPPEAPLRY